MKTKKKVKRVNKKRKLTNPIDEAIKYGIDITLLYKSVSLSPTQRMEIHQQMLEFLEEARKNLQRMGRPYYCKGKVVL